MPELTAVGISGSPRTPSKSKALAELMLGALARLGCKTELVDLATLPADALLARGEDADVADAIATVGQAQIIVASTPTYRALYTGLLKCFFDLMPPGHLQAKVCVPVQTAAVPHHALAVEYGLRPLFMSLDGIPLAGVYATDAEFVEGVAGAVLCARIETVAAAARAVAGG